MTHETGIQFGNLPNDLMAGGTVAEDRPPLADNKILHNGQYIAMVVAETLEKAQYGASLVRVNYAPAPFTVDLEQAAATKFSPKEFMGEPLTFERGTLKQGLSSADVIIEETYTTPVEHPCPLELLTPPSPLGQATS